MSPRGASLMVRAEITASASICDIVDCVQVRGSDRLSGVYCAFCGLCTDRNDAKVYESESKLRE